MIVGKGLLGRATTEQDEERVKRGESHPTWVGAPEGHVPIEEARERALARVAEREAKVLAAVEKLAEAERDLRLANQRRNAADAALAKSRTDLAQAQADLARRCGFSLDVETIDTPVEG